MPRIVSVSFPDDKGHLVDDLDAIAGSRSGHIVEAIEIWLDSRVKVEDGSAPPPWYKPGRDYSHLAPEIRERLKAFGYKEELNNKL